MKEASSLESMIENLEDFGASECSYVMDVVKDFMTYHIEIKITKMD